MTTHSIAAKNSPSAPKTHLPHVLHYKRELCKTEPIKLILKSVPLSHCNVCGPRYNSEAGQKHSCSCSQQSVSRISMLVRLKVYSVVVLMYKFLCPPIFILLSSRMLTLVPVDLSLLLFINLTATRYTV